MIRVNSEGLSDAEADSILFPLAPNCDSVLDISRIRANFQVALERYGKVMDETISSIDDDPAHS